MFVNRKIRDIKAARSIFKPLCLIWKDYEINNIHNNINDHHAKSVWTKKD